ncbi:MAG: MaoC/PaaZ C-terminal domain-containing protein, partial [Spirochaetaceae bacterium]|nr:MaoC/PaaZ C-terminal domain-containing protein [Spirochaetaceae bacterium]
GGAAFYGLAVGMFTEKKRTFAAADLAEYGDLSGDRNPLLRDAAYARACGLAGPVVPWPLLGGMFSDMLGTHLPGRGTGWMKQKLVYASAAYPGEELTARVEITRLRPDKELVNLRSTIISADGRLVCDGESLVLVRNLENKGDKGPLFGRG